jgi:hypothetical protein
MVPQPGYLWTPAWWGWENNAFAFHEGYWATQVGWYGGVNYGYGYWGHGFGGGRWDHDRFFYNTAVVHVNETVIRNVYIDKTVIINNNVTVNRVSYNGGEGGIREQPTPQEEAVSRERHMPPVQAQEQHRQMARSNPQLRASANQGKPPVAATARPAEFSGHDVVAAREAGAPYHPPANRAAPGGNPKTANPPTHARDLPPHQPAPIPENTPQQRVQKYQQQQQKLTDQQNKEHQQLQQQQQREDQQLAKEKNQQKQQQVEQRHQQQTQQMVQRHTEQQQHLQTKQQPRPPK